MLQSKLQAYFLAEELEEMAAPQLKGVIAEIEGTKLPQPGIDFQATFETGVFAINASCTLHVVLSEM